MPRPRLIHPVSVTVQPLDRTNTHLDRDAREPIPAQARAAAVTIKAQVHWSRLRDVVPEAAGPVEKRDGWLVFLRSDLEAASWTPGPGDRVTAIEGVTAHLYLTGDAQQRGQYAGRHNLVRCDFEDRGSRRD